MVTWGVLLRLLDARICFVFILGDSPEHDAVRPRSVPLAINLFLVRLAINLSLLLLFVARGGLLMRLVSIAFFFS
jgi:hypothetical protein